MTRLLEATLARTLPSVRLTFDFLAVLAVALILLWLTVVMPISALVDMSV